MQEARGASFSQAQQTASAPHFFAPEMSAEGAEKATTDAPAHIQLKVKDQQGSEVQFKIKKATPLRKLMDAYCSRLGLQASQVRFMVDGERIAPDDTAEKLGLEDEDLIDVAMEQTGGDGLHWGVWHQ